MKRKACFLLIVCCIFTVQISELYAQKNPSAEQLIAEHLKSIGDPDALSQIKPIVSTGNATVNFLLGMTGYQNQRGTFTLISQGPQMGLMMRFPDTNNYPGEHFAYDGKTVTVANYRIGQKSPIASFIHRYNKIMKNGIFGGVLSNTWPLLDVKSSKPRNMKVGKTKIGGVELYSLEYRPRDDHGDMKIRMYFDMETYRHVVTEYVVRTQNDVTMEANPANYDMGIGLMTGETVYTLVEKFDDFRAVGNLTLPHSYTLDYSLNHLGGTTMGGYAANWTMEALQWGFGAPDIDQRFFNTEK